MRALSARGIFATDCHAQLRAILLRLGLDHAALLAEPQHAPDGRSIDWYAEGDGPVAPASSLPPDEAARLRARAGELAGDIQAMLANGGAGDSSLRGGELLRLALQHPGVDDLWSAGGRPVLVNWGFAPAAADARPQDLVRSGAAIQSAGPPAVSAAATTAEAPAGADAGERRAAFWGPGCLLPLLLLLLLLWLLAALLGLLPSPLPAGCIPVPDSQADLARLESERAALEDELGRIRNELEQRAAMCRPAAQPKPAPPAILPSEPEKPAGERMEIPEDPKDLAFLEGCWKTAELSQARSDIPLDVQYCFDRKGEGEVIVTARGSRKAPCRGRARARFDGSILRVDTDEILCPKPKNPFSGQEMACDGTGRETQCRGRNKGSDITYDVPFTRTQ